MTQNKEIIEQPPPPASTTYQQIINNQKKADNNRLRDLRDLQWLMECSLKHRDEYGIKNGIRGAKTGWKCEFWKAVANDLHRVRSDVPELKWQACENNIKRAVARRRKKLEKKSEQKESLSDLQQLINN